MTGDIAQIIALTAFGNDFLKNGNLISNFNTENSTFEFCNKVIFREFENPSSDSKLKENVIATNPTDWFQYLKNEGCKYLRLYYEYSKDQSFVKDHKLAGLVGGGGSWLIEAVYDNHSNYWNNTWEVTNQEAEDNKIWSVSYTLTFKNLQTSNLQIDNNKIKENLRQTLTDIADFATKQELAPWAELFEKAKSVLESSTPESDYYHADLIPLSKFSLTAKQIIFSAGSAWVFGGMGSWNDLSFYNEEDIEMYDTLSEKLYSNINQAFIAGINSF